MATKFVFVFNTELESGLAYIWFNAKADRIQANGDQITSCLQAAHQQASEKRLLKLVKVKYPQATIWEDDGGLYRYIKTK